MYFVRTILNSPWKSWDKLTIDVTEDEDEHLGPENSSSIHLRDQLVENDNARIVKTAPVRVLLGVGEEATEVDIKNRCEPSETPNKELDGVTTIVKVARDVTTNSEN